MSDSGSVLSSGKRRICSGCGRPATVCLCHALVTRKTPFSIIIWQDPDESRHPLSTAPLLHKSLEGSCLVVGDEFEPEQLLGANWRQHSALLYPLPNKPSVNPADIEISQLLILDGTWRKVRRLIHKNPWLQEMPHMALNLEQASAYRIRKSPREDGVSTLEAGVAACELLHPEGDYAVIKGVLDALVDTQLKFIAKADS